MLFHARMVNLQSHDTFRMSTVYFESDEELFSQDLNSTGNPEYRPPHNFRTHSSTFHLKCAGFDHVSSPDVEEGCEMLNDESFEKHVSQGEHEGNLEAAGDGFESDEEFVAQLGRVVDPVPREEKAKDGAKKGDEKEERTKKPDEAKSGKDLPPVYEIHIQSLLPCVV